MRTQEVSNAPQADKYQDEANDSFHRILTCGSISTSPPTPRAPRSEVGGRSLILSSRASLSATTSASNVPSSSGCSTVTGGGRHSVPVRGRWEEHQGSAVASPPSPRVVCSHYWVLIASRYWPRSRAEAALDCAALVVPVIRYRSQTPAVRVNASSVTSNSASGAATVQKKA